MITKPSLKQILGKAFFMAFGGILIRLWGNSLRVIGLDKKPTGHYIFMFWHDSLLFIPFLLKGNRIATLVSRHHDGELIAIILKKLGYKNVRGSDTEGGIEALKEILALLRDGYSLLITPDGPKGPPHELKQGIIYMSLKSGIPIVMVEVEYEREIRLRTWDRLRIPYPFTKTRLCFREPMNPDPNLSIMENTEVISRCLFHKD